jgi:hypothetical protein
MNTSDIKIIELIDILKTLGKIKYDYEFCDSIGLLKQNLRPIKIGRIHFTAKQIESICKLYDVNANWIFGLSNNIFNHVKSIEKLKAS